MVDMGRTQIKVSEQLRRAIDGCGASRYAVCKAAGIDQALLSRFMAGQGWFSAETVDRLGEVLRLRIVAEGPARVAPPEKAGRKPKARAKVQHGKSL